MRMRTAFILRWREPDMTNPCDSKSAICSDVSPISPRRGIRWFESTNDAMAIPSPGSSAFPKSFACNLRGPPPLGFAGPNTAPFAVVGVVVAGVVARVEVEVVVAGGEDDDEEEEDDEE